MTANHRAARRRHAERLADIASITEGFDVGAAAVAVVA